MGGGGRWAMRRSDIRGKHFTSFFVFFFFYSKPQHQQWPKYRLSDTNVFCQNAKIICIAMLCKINTFKFYSYYNQLQLTRPGMFHSLSLFTVSSTNGKFWDSSCVPI